MLINRKPPKLSKFEIDAQYWDWRNRGVYWCDKGLSIDDWRERELAKINREPQ